MLQEQRLMIMKEMTNFENGGELVEESYSGKKEWKRVKKLAMIEDVNKLKDALIKYASKSKFSDKTCKLWSATYADSDEDKIYKKLKSMELGTCYGDDGGNYVVYSFKSKKFYFFDHELDGTENLSHSWTIQKIKQHLHDLHN